MRVRQHLAWFCAVLVLWGSSPSPTCAAETGTKERKPTLQEQVTNLPVGSVVKVKTRDKRTITGQLGSVTSEGFVVKHAQNNSIVEEKFAYTDVKSVKPKSDGMSTGMKITIGALAAAGIFFVIMIVAWAATGGD